MKPRTCRSPAYLRYFGDASPSRLKRPVLGAQLETLVKLVEEEEELARRREDAEIRAAEEAVAEIERRHAEATERLAALRARTAPHKS